MNVVSWPPRVDTTRPYCGVGCGIVATRDDGGGAAIAGDPDHAANFGRLCSKGSALGETLGLDGRLLHPMLRSNGGALERAEWPRALDAVALGFRCAVDRIPRAIPVIASRHVMALVQISESKMFDQNYDSNTFFWLKLAIPGPFD